MAIEGSGAYAKSGCSREMVLKSLCPHLHIYTHHNAEIINRSALSKQRTFDMMYAVAYPCKTQSVNAWVECVVYCLQPFCFVDNEVFPQHCNHQSICQSTLIKYMKCLTRHVERKIDQVLPGHFAVLHCVGEFETYPKSTKVGYEKRFLAISPVNDESSQSAQEH